MSQRIPVAGPSIGEDELKLVMEAVQGGWYDRSAEYQTRFEEAFKTYVGTRYAAALPSCTSGIHLALAALGVGPGDEVVVPDITWIATVAPVLYLGATPVFADIDPVSWCVSPDSVESVITPQTKAVIGVDLYGGMCDWRGLRAVTRSGGIALIEDAAEAIGSRLDERPAGGHADVGVFSFHGSKTMTTGEGGMLVTDRKDIMDRVAVLRDHGRAPGDTFFFNQEVGFKYRMSPMQAALGLAQLGRIEELVTKKRALFHLYRDMLGELPEVTLNAEPAGVRNSYWMTTAVLDPALGLDKKTLIQHLSDRGIDSRPFFHPLSSIPALRSHASAADARVRNTHAYGISPWGINLPSALSLEPDDALWVSCVVKALIEAYGGRQTPVPESPGAFFPSNAPGAAA